MDCDYGKTNFWLQGENEIQGNVTFKEYHMKGVLKISDLFIQASQNSYLPGKK